MSSITGWIEGILLTILVIFLVAGIVSDMNEDYGKDYNVGLNISPTWTQLINYQNTSAQKVVGGEVTQSETEGLTLGSTWALAKDIVTITWSFIGGGIIQKITTDYMRLPIIVGLVFRALYFISLVLIIGYLFFKVKV
jgi:hypothetical protein